MSMRRSALFFMVAGLAFTSLAHASDVDEDEDAEELTAGLTASTMFPNADNKASPVIKAGEPAKALVTFENEADSTMLVEFMGAQLSYASNPGQVIANLTGTLVNRTVNDGESVSMAYEIMTPKDLNPVEYALAISVYFMSEEDMERGMLVAFNETVVVTDNTSVFDLQSLFMFFLIGGSIYFGIQHFNKKQKFVAPKRAAKVSASVAPEADADDYLPKEHRRALAKKGSPARKGSN